METLLLSLLSLIHSLHLRKTEETNVAEQLGWLVIDFLLQERHGRWLSSQLLNRLLVVHFMSGCHSIDVLETVFQSHRAIVSFLGNEGVHTVRWFMMYNKPVVELNETHYIQEYLFEKKEDNRGSSIHYILYITEHSSLSKDVGNAGLFCKWLMKLLFWNNVSSEEASPVFESIAHSLLSILQKVPSLCLLNYYHLLIGDLLNIISFNRSASSLPLLYLLFSKFLEKAMEDQRGVSSDFGNGDQGSLLVQGNGFSSMSEMSTIVMDAIHLYISQFASLSIYLYEVHVDQLIQLIHSLPSNYIIPEIQAILNLLDNGFSDSTLASHASKNMDLLICLCEKCPHRMRFHLQYLIGCGLDALVYAGKMKEIEAIRGLEKSCVQFWLVLLEMDPVMIQAYLKGFYQRVHLYEMDRVYDLRDELAKQFELHAHQEECESCSLCFPLDL